MFTLCERPSHVASEDPGSILRDVELIRAREPEREIQASRLCQQRTFSGGASVLKDFCYKNVVRNDLLAYIRNDLSGDPNNSGPRKIRTGERPFQARLRGELDCAVKDVIKNLRRSNFFALSPVRIGSWRVGLWRITRFPWTGPLRSRMDIRLEVHGAP